MDFQTPIFLEFALVNNHYQISKNEVNQNFKLSAPAWFLEKLALKIYFPLKNKGLQRRSLMKQKVISRKQSNSQ